MTKLIYLNGAYATDWSTQNIHGIRNHSHDSKEYEEDKKTPINTSYGGTNTTNPQSNHSQV